MPEKKKHAHFLPPIAPLKPSLPQETQGLFARSRYTLRTEKEQEVLNQKAKMAALSNFRHLTEKYRLEGASLRAFAREVGISGNLDYAEFLAKENPQTKMLIDELALGFYAGSHHEQFNYFCETYKASFNILIARAAQNRYVRKTGLIYEVLFEKLQCAHLEWINSAFFRHKQRNRRARVTMLAPSSSEESFTLLP